MQIINSASRPGLLEGNVPGRSVNSERLERWMGREELQRVSDAMKDWYGPPIALAGVPGAVFAHRGGDFRGELRAGWEASKWEKAQDLTKRFKRALNRASKASRLQMNTGFSGLSEILSEMSIGKRFIFPFNKVGTTGVVAATNTLWFVGAMPAAGSAAGAAPGGTVPTDATTGSWAFTNPSGGDTQHITKGEPIATAIGTLLVYDRLFSVTKAMNSTATEAVTGVPTRYQSTTATAMDYVGGNFLIIECRTALAATAHNWTTCLYTDDANNINQTLPSVTGNSGCIINRLDQPTGQFYCPLATGDVGIKDLDQMQCSAAVATGAIDFTIGHPLAFLPCPTANMICVTDGINTAVNLERVFDDACMALLEIMKPATTATTYSGSFTTAYS
jgi:hypothetical protein